MFVLFKPKINLNKDQQNVDNWISFFQNFLLLTRHNSENDQFKVGRCAWRLCQVIGFYVFISAGYLDY